MMLKMKRGCSVPFPEQLREAYQIQGNWILANVDVDKLGPLMQRFIVTHREPLFFILELPANLNDETERQPIEEKPNHWETESLHRDVYYMDGCTQEEALTVLSRCGELLYHDGSITFGFGGHESGDEILSEKYNIVRIFSQNIQSCQALLNEQSIPVTENLLTAWDTFTPEHPGICNRITVDGKTVYSIPEAFHSWGMYFAERRTEN